MSLFVKTGSDATSAAIRAARSYTGKIKIIRCGYHGWHDWCVENTGGVPQSTLDDVLTFKYNDIETLKATIKANPDVAAVILTPINHPLGEKVEFPKNNFLKLVRDVCDENKIVLIFDEIRSGFRVDLGEHKNYTMSPQT